MAGLLLKLALIILLCTTGSFLSCQSQSNEQGNSNIKPVRKDLSGMAAAANKLLMSLSEKQKDKIQFDFDDNERYNWHYVPKSRKGIPLKDLAGTQHSAAMELLRTALSDTGFKKTTDIIYLEGILRGVEGRPENDDYRDPGKYYFSIFGNPATDSIWGWRLEGHHISFNFSALNNTIVSGTPGFLGTNPAVVLSGPEKGKYILKNETELGFTLLHSLDAGQAKNAIIDNDAPSEIITGSDRKAMIKDPEGILYSELNSSQQKLFMQLLSVYIHRYTRLFAQNMMKEIESAGMDKLRFAWAGSQQQGLGNPHYYRIHGPTIIIEY
ncbi:MAG TPA: DUF3500 domain-containing protein, partial [Chitinophagaceae bacterium]|nr:DUF3500 domain-containing protein [Chitinophagaceae bacterium]